MALPVVSDRTELGYDFSLLSGKGRLREVTLPFGVVAIVILLIAFFVLFRTMDAIEYGVSLWLFDVWDEAMHEWVVAVVIDFDHKFIYL